MHTDFSWPSSLKKISGSPTVEGMRPEAEIQRVAAQFEALLLAQMTSALNAAGDEENDLFQGAGTDLYRQMFSEQLARTMAESGGIGLRELIVRQLPGRQQTDRAASLESESGERFTPAQLHRLVEVVRKEVASPSSETRGASSPVSLPNPSDHYSGIDLPLAGRISSGFGPRRDPLTGEVRFHAGVDIAAAKGTPIAAVGEGTVIFAGQQRGYGRTILIQQADGLQTRYAHADEILVAQGERITAGQVIATVGATGRATGPHLHFEVIRNGYPADPLSTISASDTNKPHK